MGKPINKETKKLDELLDHLNNDTGDLDAFEQEALEGFASLSGKQEALDLKNRLDERIEKELFEKKKRPVFIYWSAAAGFILLIGLVVLFKNVNRIEQQDLAMNNEKSLESKPLEGLNQPLAQDKTETDQLSNSLKEKDVAGKTAKADQKAREQNGEMRREDANAQMGMAAAEAKEEPAKTMDAESDLDKAPTTKNMAPPSAPAGGAAANVISPEEKKIKDAFAKTAEDERKADDAGELSTRSIVKGKKKDTNKSNAAPSAASKEEVASEISGPFEKSSISNAKLSVTESELYEKINKFMSDKSYKKSFKCTLTINSSNMVEEVNFADISQFKRSEIKELREFFKKLKCFKNNEYSLYSTYNIHYKAE